MSTAIVITSGKGGTGKTSITGGVASCLAALGHRVLCIDMDIGLRNLDISLGMTDRALMDFSDVALGRCPLARGAVDHPDVKGLSLLTAPMSLSPSLTIDKVRAMLDTARGQYDYILIDSPAGLGAGFRLAICGADRALVIATNQFCIKLAPIIELNTDFLCLINHMVVGQHIAFTGVDDDTGA